MAASNRLGEQTSPYLLQHANNPVDWYPWGPEALERARREQRPILLSIGYSACHWCHVMAHESFEDEATARVMNAHFVNIKVDREERPDLDRIYQTAHQLLTQRPGGWPLTLFLTPDQIPFAAGTYFPPEPRHGLPGFTTVLERVADYYRTRRTEINEQNASLSRALTDLAGPSGAAPGRLDDRPIRRALQELQAAFDPTHGGFGQAPKFPHTPALALLLRESRRRVGLDQAQHAAIESLRAMIRGGMFDQLGGGFFRYSVDERWEIPHFEKMLYDNGPLLEAAVDAWQVTGDGIFRQAALLTAEWVVREMQSPEGGYYATLDADSEREPGGGPAEGSYYLWTPEEMAQVLEGNELGIALRCFGLDRPANFEGRWHLTRRTSPSEAAAALGLAPDAASSLLESARRKLLEARSERPRPGRDEKVLPGWNGLMIRAMASAGRRLREPRLVDSAEKALAFARTHLLCDGRLAAVYKDGQARLNGYLDDYASLADGALTLLEARWDTETMALASRLCDVLLEHFEDPENGGFFFTADDHESLIQRPKPFMDESLPAGNGTAASVLIRMGHLTGSPRYLEAAERTLRAGWESLGRAPSMHGALLRSLEEYLEPPQLVVLRGDGEAQQWYEALDTEYAPERLILSIPRDSGELPVPLAAKRPIGNVVGYVCAGQRCAPPVHNLPTLEALLRDTA